MAKGEEGCGDDELGWWRGRMSTGGGGAGVRRGAKGFQLQSPVVNVCRVVKLRMHFALFLSSFLSLVASDACTCSFLYIPISLALLFRLRFVLISADAAAASGAVRIWDDAKMQECEAGGYVVFVTVRDKLPFRWSLHPFSYLFSLLYPFVAFPLLSLAVSQFFHHRCCCCDCYCCDFFAAAFFAQFVS